MNEDGSQLLVNVSLIYTRLSLLLAAVDRGSRAVNDTRRINHAAKTLEYSHIRRRAATLKLHAVVEASAATTSRDDDVLALGCR
jgi:hypothetical protein